MRSFLERYERGEHEQVWDDLLALGDGVREEPFYADARAVAHETMRRTRHNLELLVARLATMGYRFGYDSWISRTEEPENWALVESLAPPPPFLPAQAQVHSQLDAFEARFGTLPLSLRAWFEQVGAV